MAYKGHVTVEFFGMPRQRAGRAELCVQADTVAELLNSVVKTCPGLADIIQADGRPAPQYLLSINGQRFADRATQPLVPGSRVVLLSADAGG
jgi:molybdopterin converting factor small subunit